METRKLYYEDCHLQTFAAQVLSCRPAEEGWIVTLDATAFYPEGGGQPCDLGTLGGVNVLDVREQGHQVLHLCDGPLTPGERVEGQIRWQRRFDLMQQHSGEHIISGIVYAKYGYHNVGFHMGAELITIDFDGIIPPEDLPEIEKTANEAVWSNLPLACWFPSRQELQSLTYRSKRALDWPVRIVRVPGFDDCACCGTHVAFTGEIGPVKLLSCMKFHQGVRIEMVCGSRALELLSRVYEQNKLVCQAFSAKLLETGAAAQRMNAQLAAEKYRATGLQQRLFAAIAAGYAGAGDVVHFEPGLENTQVRELADRIADTCGGVAAVLSGTDEAGYALCLVSRGGDVKALGTELTAALGGRGGGKAGFFQGSVKGTKEAIDAFFTNKNA